MFRLSNLSVESKTDVGRQTVSSGNVPHKSLVSLARRQTLDRTFTITNILNGILHLIIFVLITRVPWP